MATLFTETFETDGNGTRYTTSIPEFSDGLGDFFTRSDGSNIGSFVNYNNPGDSFYFAAQDIDGEGAASQQTLTFSGINISGFTNLNLSTLLAEDDSSDGNEDWDSTNDFVLFEYQIDGGGFNSLLAIENDGSTFNSAPLQDTDFNGIGDGTEVTSTFASFSNAITGTGSTLDLKITIDFNSGDEDIAIDNIEIAGDGGTGGTNLVIAATDAVKAEGDSGTTNFSFTVTRSDTTDATSVDFTVSGIEADTTDFGGSFPTGVVNFSAGGGSTAMITIPVTGDTDFEPDENFTVTLSNPTNGATITTATANGTIENDDGGSFTPISAIQGSGTTSPLESQTVTVEAVVVGDFQDGDTDTGRDLEGFYVQEEDSDVDGDSSTSEGLFVFENGNFLSDVNVGDLVQVTGVIDEFFGETQLEATNVTVVSSGNTLPTAVNINLPSAGTSNAQDGDLQPDLEAYEGMLVNFPQELTITEMFQLDRFNEIKLSQGGRLEQFTQNNAPSVSGLTAHLQDIGSRTITYDDGLNQQNASIGNLDGFGPTFNTATDIRMGDTITNLSGVLDYKWAGSSSSGATWRVRSTTHGENTFTKNNTRPTTPDNVGGDLTVASLNVLNYFTTLDTSGTTTANGSDPRGADTQDEFERQTDKLVTAILDIDADILGLVEIENDFQPGSSGNAIENLVNELNADLGSNVYDWVDPGQQFVDSSDAISVGVIYKQNVVDIASGTTVEILDDSDLPGLGLNFGNAVFDGVSTNRASLAVSFEETASGETFTLAVNHFKSKGSVNSAPGNTDIGDGQGNNNAIRVQGATALDAWLESDPTGSGDSDFLIVGDLNAYGKEDPITFLEGENYTDLAEQFVGNDAYSYVFDGQTGTLDYALANDSLLSQVTGATEWHINADEADALDYNLDFGRDQNIFDGTVPFRTSDHDPIILGLDLADSNTNTPTPGNDVLTGTEGDDTIKALAGDDEVTGLGGNDRLVGNRGEDTLEGDTGDDRLFGGRDSDSLLGGVGNDVVAGGPGEDILNGAGDGSLGVGERDVLKGGNSDGSTDLFILGDSSNVYYLGNGNTDRAVIRQFEQGTDLIVLPGGIGDYNLNFNSNNSNATIREGSTNDLIAIVRQAPGVLTGSDFEFIN